MLTRMVLISWPRDPPALASQSAGITGVSHCTRSSFSFLRQGLVLLPRFECSSTILVIATSAFQAQATLPPASWVAGATGVWHNTHIIFSIFCRVGVSPCCSWWSQTRRLKWYTCLGLPKCLDYKCKLPCLAQNHTLKLLLTSCLRKIVHNSKCLF